jgi:NADH:ubiquinone oxidoreductase subunit 5 (subunit L)/multisubunit Na+/H+ antiporter MnhA subunit
MFMVAGLIYAARGNDRVVGLGGIARALPMSICAFALSGAALIGLPPSGAYLAKQLLLQAVAETDQWWWAVVIQTGGILTSAYVVVVLVHALAPRGEPVTLRIPRIRQAPALALALCSLLLGLIPWQGFLSGAADLGLAVLSVKALSAALWPVLLGGVVAILLGRWGNERARPRFGKVVLLGQLQRATLAFSDMIERLDGTLRQWVAAGISLLTVAVLLGATIFAGQ